jgi:hypothetical protein
MLQAVPARSNFTGAVYVTGLLLRAKACSGQFDALRGPVMALSSGISAGARIGGQVLERGSATGNSGGQGLPFHALLEP